MREKRRRLLKLRQEKASQKAEISAKSEALETTQVEAQNREQKVVRWRTYYRDKENLVVSRNQKGHYYVVTNTLTVRCYKVTKKEGTNKGSCTCEDYVKNTEKGKDVVCKHMLAVKRGDEKRKAEENGLPFLDIPPVDLLGDELFEKQILKEGFKRSQSLVDGWKTLKK